MRIKAIGDGGSLFAAVLILVTWVAAAIFLLTGWMAKDAFSAESQCFIGRVAWDQAQAQQKHPFIFTFPKDLSRDFIVAWNTMIESAQVSPRADSVSIYSNGRNAASVRVAFFDRGCLVDSFDATNEAFWKVIGLASGPKRWHI